MPSPVSSIRNVGPAMEAGFARAGITSAEDLREMGTDIAYARYLAAGGTAHFISYYTLEMGLQGRPWNDCKGAEKDRLRARFDKIKSASTAPDNGIEHALDMLGVLPATRLQERNAQ